MCFFRVLNNVVLWLSLCLTHMLKKMYILVIKPGYLTQPHIIYDCYRFFHASSSEHLYCNTAILIPFLRLATRITLEESLQLEPIEPFKLSSPEIIFTCLALLYKQEGIYLHKLFTVHFTIVVYL